MAWSASPLLIFPTHYTGDTGYISDTEDSAWLQQQLDDGVAVAEDAEKKGKRESYERSDEAGRADEVVAAANEEAVFESVAAAADILSVDLLVADAKTEL